MNDEKRCFFSGINGYCRVLTETACNGFSLKCTFRKTEKQYISERDAAIRACRKRGLCEKCQYVPLRCKTSKE